ncbi:hypothetical protein [Sporolactobacillus putidus]|uniref:Uncharacterized protein n=1 Tax=Sporolactobacillus putidus TaxID=492735 RepID=A0A917W2N9_9BACL|nr:hypothetical protein [Sporolactobacillus putidus]GGL55834.1 hypothetical protein GCM10007968_19890 [Sporolactobacillus putidus]
MDKEKLASMIVHISLDDFMFQEQLEKCKKDYKELIDGIKDGSLVKIKIGCEGTKNNE